MRKIGCHLSASKGFMHMAEEALSIGADTFQFFTRNPRGGRAKAVDRADIDAYLRFAPEHGIGVILAHAPYTLNPCSAEEKTREFAYITMSDDLARMELIPGNMYNFHPGSHVKQGAERGIELIADLLNRVLTPEMTTTVLLETMAGKGTEIGRAFEELRAVIDRTELNEKLGVCLDTCHVYDAGYDILGNLSGVLDEFDRIIGLDRLCAIHVNDTKNPFASHKDRHEKLGGGFLGQDAFRALVNEPRLKGIPMYLETPNELDGYRREIAMLRAMEIS